MKKWNGRCRDLQYSLDDAAAWNMEISDDGTVYYTTHEKNPRQMVWCPASALYHHLWNLWRRGIKQVTKVDV